ncbi:MAG TPA: hypothetical protein VH917_06730 [Ignavibacteriaceae bacterium]|jgi:hypothetical protein
MNSELKRIAERLQENINKISSDFLKYSEEELRKKPAPNKWSKKEILGHLIDSAANNHHRFIRSQFESEPFKVFPYEQEHWVRIQNYNELDSKFIVEMWKIYNLHLKNIIADYPEGRLKMKCESTDNREIAENLFLLIKDYVDHMDHHFKQIF